MSKKIFQDPPFMFPGEVAAITTVLEAGKRYGYGNMIGHLQREWDLSIEASLKEFHGRRPKRSGKGV